jgi:hypothetical protein
LVRVAQEILQVHHIKEVLEVIHLLVLQLLLQLAVVVQQEVLQVLQHHLMLVFLVVLVVAEQKAEQEHLELQVKVVPVELLMNRQANVALVAEALVLKAEM